MSSLILTAPGLPETPDHHLSVDGMSPVGPNLSHWPGNRTPVKWKADLSTGICLRFAEAPVGEREDFLDGATHALNDHYDTDGFGSLLAVLRPEVAVPRAEVLLAAAGAGDFQAFDGWRGFAIDRIVAGLAGPRGPLSGSGKGKGVHEKNLLRYRWLMDHAEEVLDGPEAFAPIYAEELAQVERELGDASTTVEHFPEVGLAWVRSAGPVHRMVLNTLAEDCYRVLHTAVGEDGARVRFHDRTESWFEVVSFSPRPRMDLEPLRRELAARERELGGLGAGSPGAGELRAGAEWCLDPANEPVPELYFGPEAVQQYGIISRELTPSRIPPEELAARFCAHLGAQTA